MQDPEAHGRHEKRLTPSNVPFEHREERSAVCDRLGERVQSGRQQYRRKEGQRSLHDVPARSPCNHQERQRAKTHEVGQPVANLFPAGTLVCAQPANWLHPGIKLAPRQVEARGFFFMSTNAQIMSSATIRFSNCSASM